MILTEGHGPSILVRLVLHCVHGDGYGDRVRLPPCLRHEDIVADRMRKL